MLVWLQDERIISLNTNSLLASGAPVEHIGHFQLGSGLGYESYFENVHILDDSSNRRDAASARAVTVVSKRGPIALKPMT